MPVRLIRRRDQFHLSLAPDAAEQDLDLAVPGGGRQDRPLCSMCGPKFGSMKITQGVRVCREGDERDERHLPGGRQQPLRPYAVYGLRCRNVRSLIFFPDKSRQVPNMRRAELMMASP